MAYNCCLHQTANRLFMKGAGLSSFSPLATDLLSSRFKYNAQKSVTWLLLCVLFGTFDLYKNFLFSNSERRPIILPDIPSIKHTSTTTG